MKLLHLVRSLGPEWGGPIEGVRQQLQVWTKVGVNVEIVTLDGPEEHLDVNIDAPVHRLGPSYGAYGWTPHLVPWLLENSRRFNVCIINGIWTYNCAGAANVLQKTKTPYVIFCHGMLDPWFKTQYPLKHLKKLIYWTLWERHSIANSAALLFTCETEMILARQSFPFYRPNEVVVRYGTAGVPDQVVGVGSDLQVRFPDLVGKKVVLFVGRIHPKKGCDLVIEAFADVFGGESEWHLLMVGPDQVGWRAELETIARRRSVDRQITWTGLLTGADKWSAFRLADVFFLPSHQENFGIVVAEALSCRLPVLVSDKVNIWREVVEANAGVVAADTLTGARELLAGWRDLDVEERDGMREAARLCFETYFEIEEAVMSLGRVLAQNARTK